jgi:hypothetical protein
MGTCKLTNTVLLDRQASMTLSLIRTNEQCVGGRWKVDKNNLQEKAR